MSDFDWPTKLGRWFAAGPTDDGAWSRAKERAPIGSQVNGTVIALAPFGVWVDIDVGFPALLEVPNILGAWERRLQIEDYPREGSTLIAQVLGFRDDNRQV